MTAGRFGARPGVLRSLGLDQTTRSDRVVSHETASCGICRSQLRFSTGSYGQSLEACSSPRCPNRFPHHPQADTAHAEDTRRQKGSDARKRRRSGSTTYSLVTVLSLMLAAGVVGVIIGAVFSLVGLVNYVERSENPRAARLPQ